MVEEDDYPGLSPSTLLDFAPLPPHVPFDEHLALEDHGLAAELGHSGLFEVAELSPNVFDGFRTPRVCNEFILPLCHCSKEIQLFLHLHALVPYKIPFPREKKHG